MNLFLIIFKTIFFYILILIIFRIMGKREMGQLSIQELSVTVLITELCAISIENYDEPMINTIAPLLILLSLELIGGYLSIKFNKFRNIIQGKPSLIINRGIINYKEMIKQRYTLDDLLCELRSKKIKDLRDVEYAVLENNGNLSIFKYNFLEINSNNPFPLILDGKIQKDTLTYINKDNKWLLNNLKNNDLKDIFYAFYKNNKVYIIKRNELKQ